MRPRTLKTVVDQIKMDAVFHQDSIVLYEDKSWSLAKVEHDKKIVRIYSAEEFDGKADRVVRELCTYQKMKTSHAMKMVRDMQAALTKRRGADLAFHYDLSERNMIDAAARIAAREPETAVLYWNYDTVKMEAPKLRFMISPGRDIDDIYKGKNDASCGGVAMYHNGVVAVGHEADRTNAAVTVHELVHAYDLKLGMVSDKLPQGIFERTLARADWVDATLERHKQGLSLDEEQRVFMEGFIPLFEAMQKDRRMEGMNMPLVGLTLLKGLKDLPEDLYPDAVAKRRELMPTFEEFVAVQVEDRMNLDAPGRTLAEYCFPELGGFVREQYLMPLKKDYEKVKADNLFLMDGNDLAKPKSFITRFDVMRALKGRKEKDRELDLAPTDRNLLDPTRWRLASVLARTDNYGLQEHGQKQEDDILKVMTDIFKTGRSEQQAQLLALEEFTAMHAAVKAARQAISAGAGRAGGS